MRVSSDTKILMIADSGLHVTELEQWSMASRQLPNMDALKAPLTDSPVYGAGGRSGTLSNVSVYFAALNEVEKEFQDPHFTLAVEATWSRYTRLHDAILRSYDRELGNIFAYLLEDDFTGTVSPAMPYTLDGSQAPSNSNVNLKTAQSTNELGANLHLSKWNPDMVSIEKWRNPNPPVKIDTKTKTILDQTAEKATKNAPVAIVVDEPSSTWTLNENLKISFSCIGNPKNPTDPDLYVSRTGDISSEISFHWAQKQRNGVFTREGLHFSRSHKPAQGVRFGNEIVIMSSPVVVSPDKKVVWICHYAGPTPVDLTIRVEAGRRIIEKPVHFPKGQIGVGENHRFGNREASSHWVGFTLTELLGKDFAAFLAIPQMPQFDH